MRASRLVIASISFCFLASFAAHGAAQAKKPSTNPSKTVRNAVPKVLSGATVKPQPLGDGTYVGEIRAFAAELVPDGWTECDGRSLPVTNHARLFDVIGTRFGVDDAGRFRIPNLRGAFVRGWNHGRANTEDGPYDPDAKSGRVVPGGGPAYPGGDTDHVGTYQRDALASHHHTIVLGRHFGDKEHPSAQFGWGGDDGAREANTQVDTNAVGGSETRPGNVDLI